MGLAEISALLDGLAAPTWVVALAVAVWLGAKVVVMVRESSPTVGPSTDEAGDRREILTLVRQSHALQDRHVEEIKLLREILDEHHQRSEKAIEKIKEIHKVVTTEAA